MWAKMYYGRNQPMMCAEFKSIAKATLRDTVLITEA